MASLSAACLFAVFLLFAVVQISSSLSCYKCGKLDSGCNDPFDDKTKANYAKPCPTGTKACLKIVNPEEGDVSERMCADAEGCDAYKKCYSCTDELCNTSSNIVPSFIVMGIVSIVFGFRNY